MAVKLFLFFVLFRAYLLGQNYWVYFLDKKNVEFDPFSYFDSKAIERRLSIGYDLCDSSDFPVNEDYIRQVSFLVDSISYASRWLNALAVWASENQISEVKQLYFVKVVEPIKNTLESCSYNFLISDEVRDTSLNFLSHLLVFDPQVFVDMGITGKGVRIAVFDAGFKGVDTHPAFEKIQTNKQIISTWDFVRKKEFVYDYNIHGTMVLSCIAGYYHDGRLIGLAPDAEFLLARTEKSSEPFSEEVNWVAALEWADKNGAHIVNSSLGYTYHRYFPYQMDGKTSLVSRMANKAAAKGILVINAAGNDGNTNWRFIGAPADADSILTVGGADPKTYLRIFFSSYGPTADMRRKPDVIAFAKVLLANAKDFTIAYGTSFAAPQVTGFAACLKQIYPNIHPIELKNKIICSGHLYPYFDYAHGYGIPSAKKILDTNFNQTPTFNIIINDNKFIFEAQSVGPNAVDMSDKARKYLYYSIINEHDLLCNWSIINVKESRFEIPLKIACSNAREVCFHYSGTTICMQINH